MFLQTHEQLKRNEARYKYVKSITLVKFDKKYIGITLCRGLVSAFEVDNKVNYYTCYCWENWVVLHLP